MSGPLDFGGGSEEQDEERRRRLERREDPDQRAERLGGVPPVPQRRSGMPRGGRTWRTPLALAAIFGLLVALLLNGLQEDETQPGPTVGERLPPFAAPLANSSLEGAVNLRFARPEGGGKLACEVRGPDVLNICELYERGPVVLAFMLTQGQECVRQLDTFERVRARHPGVAFAAVALGEDRDRVRRLIRDRGWGFPVGFDEEGLLASVYGVAVCPLVVFARRGGTVTDTSFGEVGGAELDAQVGALERRR